MIVMLNAFIIWMSIGFIFHHFICPWWIETTCQIKINIKYKSINYIFFSEGTSMLIWPISIITYGFLPMLLRIPGNRMVFLEEMENKFNQYEKSFCNIEIIDLLDQKK